LVAKSFSASFTIARREGRRCMRYGRLFDRKRIVGKVSDSDGCVGLID